MEIIVTWMKKKQNSMKLSVLKSSVNKYKQESNNKQMEILLDSLT